MKHVRAILILCLSIFCFACGQNTPLKPAEDVTLDILAGYDCLQESDADCLTEIINSYYSQALTPDTELTDLLDSPQDYVGKTIIITAVMDFLLDANTFTLETNRDEYAFFLQGYTLPTIPVEGSTVTVKLRIDRYKPGWYGEITKKWYDRSIWATFITF